MPLIEPTYVPPPTLATSITAPAPVYLTPAQQQALAEQYAPILYFHPEEQNFLQDPNTFLAESTLVREVDGYVDRNGVHTRPDETLYGRGEVPSEVLARIPKSNEDADAQLYLDHRNEDLGDGVRAGNLGNSLNTYQYDPQTRTITYHLFYAYNDGPPGVGDVQNHEGDWERITVQLDDNARQPLEVRYSAHNGMDVARSWADAPKEDGRPVSYVGQGSHANYPEPGTWATNAATPAFDLRGIPIPSVPLVNDVASADGTRFDLASRPATDVLTQPWHGGIESGSGGYVFWGERGTARELGIGETTGPTGPSATKGPIGEDADPDRQPLDGAGLAPQFVAYQIPNFFGNTLPAALETGWNATDHFVTDTVPGALGDGWNAAEEFVTETAPGAAEEFVTDTVPGWAGDAGDAIGDIDLPDIPDVDLPDVDVPDLPDPRDIDIPGI